MSFNTFRPSDNVNTPKPGIILTEINERCETGDLRRHIFHKE